MTGLAQASPAAIVATSSHPEARSVTPACSVHLLYHELRPQRSAYAYALDTAQFDSHLQLCRGLEDKAGLSAVLPVITFDDGHRSNFEYALPLLARHGMRAVFFITAGWTGQREGYMNWPELRAVQAAGHLIGAHGWSHTLLTRCKPAQLQVELVQARAALEDGLGAPVTALSLPGGRGNANVLNSCAEAGYTRIYTSVPRAESMPLGHLVGRVNVRGDWEAGNLAALLEPRSTRLARLERADRIKRSLQSVLGDRAYASLWSLLNRQEAGAAEGERTIP